MHERSPDTAQPVSTTEETARSTAVAGPRHAELAQLAADIGSSPRVAAQRAQMNGTAPQPANRNRLPAQWKQGIEALSGISMDHVRVHYNSSKPAQLQAHAYAQGADIHVAPGQERHLPHEAWHVVQQMRGHVKPTAHTSDGTAINDHPTLEAEADVMGALAQSGHHGWQGNVPHRTTETNSSPMQFAPKRGKRAPRIPGANLKRQPQSPEAKAEKKAQKLERIAEDRRQKRERKIQQARDVSGKVFGVPFKNDGTEKQEELTVNPFRSEVSKAEVTQSKAVHSGLKVQYGLKITDFAGLEEDWIVGLVHGDPKWKLYEDLHVIAVTLELQGRSISIYFKTDNVDLLEKALQTRIRVIEEQAEPRSGRGRAAPNDLKGSERVPANQEAAYAEGTGAFYHIPEAATAWRGSRTSSEITSTIVHSRAWAKGIRSPGQAATMGNQNAKNYVAKYLIIPNLPPGLNAAAMSFGGRYEWLHLIGSSLGGPNTASNLVAGSYDANTKMIALEHRAARWGKNDYVGEFRPTDSKPIKIQSKAQVYPNTNVGTSIELTVSHGSTTVLHGKYDLSSQTVLTKAEYDEEENLVKAQINKHRTVGGLNGGVNDDDD